MKNLICIALLPMIVFGVSICHVKPVDAQSNVPSKKGKLTVPSFKDVIDLSSARSPRISADGSMIVYSVRSNDWKENRFDTEIWLARMDDEPFQLTRTKDGSSSNPRWSPDGKKIAFIADRGDKGQIFVISPFGGEAWQLTESKENVGNFRWSPSGSSIAYTCVEEQAKDLKQREKAYGKFDVEDQDYRFSHLWSIDVSQDNPKAKRITEGDTFTVGSFEFSPDGKKIAFDHRPTPSFNSVVSSDISVVTLSNNKIQLVVDRKGPVNRPIWSPNGKSILFSTTQDDVESFFYLNGELAVVNAKGGDIKVLTTDFDEDPGNAVWNKSGIYFLAFEKTRRRLYRLDKPNGQIKVVDRLEDSLSAFDFSKDAKTMAISSDSADMLPEIFRVSGSSAVEQITALTDQVEDWALGQSEVIQWNSLDGTEIEGVLYKPDDFDASKRYPLLVIIHGGPTGISRPGRVSGYVYPVAQWLAKGAVVLMPNYRGSAGYGEKFRSLNVRNLGVGDMWDVMSGVEFLVDQGIADPEKLGAMGWSQGGYISAFLSTNTNKFQAISVGAGISNWMTYYVNTDIHPFTRQYLKATPWDDPNIYAKTSPMTNIRNASTPTLIQHGEFDLRVPIPNARELFQGLQDNDVPTKLVVYKGFGHGITKPKELLAATWHNWQWFSKYIWEEEVELPLPELEKKEGDEKENDDEK